MKSLSFFIIFLLSVLVVSGQSGLSQVKIAASERDSPYRELLKVDAYSMLGKIIMPEQHQVQFGFQDNRLTPFYRDFFLNPFVNKLEISGNIPFFTPFFPSITITSFASYNLGNKVSLEGAGFSGKSVFDLNPFDTNMNGNGSRGASMFLQYKISKKFRIGGGISIQNHGGSF